MSPVNIALLVAILTIVILIFVMRCASGGSCSKISASKMRSLIAQAQYWDKTSLATTDKLQAVLHSHYAMAFIGAVQQLITEKEAGNISKMDFAALEQNVKKHHVDNIAAINLVYDGPDVDPILSLIQPCL